VKETDFALSKSHDNDKDYQFIRFARGGKFIAAASHDGVFIHIFDVETGK
jgi:hypothetical protein